MAGSSSEFVSIYAAREAQYGVTPALAAANYLRQLECSVEHDPFGYAASPERVPGQDLQESFQRRSATTCRLSAILRGGEDGTGLPELDPLLAEAMGSAGIVVDAAADVTGDTNKDRILGVVGATDGMLRPQLGGAAEPLIALSGAAQYKSVAYNLGNELNGVSLRRQPLQVVGAADGTGPGTKPAPSMVVSGWVIAETTITVDGTEEATIEFSGPARNTLQGSSAGANIAAADIDDLVDPPNGLTGKHWFRNVSADGSAWQQLTAGWRTLTVRQTSPRTMRNDEAGSSLSRGAYITGRRETMIDMSTYAEEGNELWEALRAAVAAGGSGPYFAYFATMGTVDGGRFGVYCPRVRFTLPTDDDGTEPMVHTFMGRAHARTQNDGNSSLTLLFG